MTNDTSELSTLWVCWTRPDEFPAQADSCILSFMLPSQEEEVERQWQGDLIRAREESLSIRNDARDLYIDLVARIGTADYGHGLTLRQALTPRGESSLWWYHPVAFKDCESDPTLDWLIAGLTICKVAKARGARKLVMVGAAWQLTEVLRSSFVIEEIATTSPRSKMTTCLRALASRLKYGVTGLRRLIAVRRHASIPDKSFEVLFSSFWDWSVWWNEDTRSLVDRYFKQLPNELTNLGASVGWLAWFDPHADPGKHKRSLKDVLARLSECHDVVILQLFLKLWDFVRVLADFDPFIRFLKVLRRPGFKKVLSQDGLDFYPLFSEQLLRGFLDASLPHNKLVAIATKRSLCKYQPKITLSFVEHFPYSRAHYSAAHQAGAGTICAAVQHASYNHEKTFLALHPSIEFKGEPDGCAVPHPDFVCVMGSLGRELFLECGYPSDAVILTGSPRYDHLRASTSELSSDRNGEPGRDAGGVRVLIVCALDANVELEMIDAVCTAVNETNGIRLLVRDHPFSRMEQHPKFARYKDQVAVTRGSLDDDLRNADLILFSHSTVAEEALLRGKPVWQWLPLRFNGSALGEVPDIPRFASTNDLRKALAAFAANAGGFVPKSSTRELVAERLFYRVDGCAAKRVAKVVTENCRLSLESVTSGR